MTRRSRGRSRAASGLPFLVLGVAACVEPRAVQVGASPMGVPGAAGAPGPAMTAEAELRLEPDALPEVDECMPPGTFASPGRADLDVVFVVEASNATIRDDLTDFVGGFLGDERTAGMRVGLVFYPRHNSCDPAEYTTLDVPLEPVAGNIAAAHERTLWEALKYRALDGATPALDPALTGVLGMSRADSLAREAPDAVRRVLVLVMAGVPINRVSKRRDNGEWDCAIVDPDVGWNQARRTLAVGRQLSPPIHSFLVGLGRGMRQPTVVAEATRAAEAGGGSLIGSESIEELATQILEIAKLEFGCQYELPPPPEYRRFEFDQFHLTYADGDGTVTPLVQVTAEHCGIDGWYFDDPVLPRHIVLCPSLCRTARAATEPRVNVHFGCTQRVAR